MRMKLFRAVKVLQMWQLLLVEFMLFIEYENGFLVKMRNESAIFDERLHDWLEFIPM